MARRSKTASIALEASFETTRISKRCLIDAYEHLTPIMRHHLPASRRPKPVAVGPTRRRVDHA